MSEPPLVPSPLYGLRTWTVVGGPGSERLAGPQRRSPWPAGGEWLEAACARGHPAPDPACDCGVHAWHPRPRSARRVLATRRDVPGVVEATGAVEVHGEGFRAQRARPYALVLDARRNPALVRRLAAAYDVPVAEVGGPQALLAWCRSRGLGLDEAVVGELLGPFAGPPVRARTPRRRDALRLAVAVAVIALLLLLGAVATDPPGDRPLQGRTGEVRGDR